MNESILLEANSEKSNTKNIFENGRNPVFAFVWDHCKTNFLAQKNLFTANITMCGCDYYCLSENEMDAKLDLCNMLMQSRYIQKKFIAK